MTSPDLPERPQADPCPLGPARWALSPLDYHAHVLTDGDQPLGVVTARCGALLPMVVTEHEHPPGRTCPPYEVIFRAGLDSPGRFERQALAADSDGGRNAMSQTLWKSLWNRPTAPTTRAVAVAAR